jgi:hypothetical protein
VQGALQIFLGKDAVELFEFIAEHGFDLSDSVRSVKGTSAFVVLRSPAGGALLSVSEDVDACTEAQAVLNDWLTGNAPKAAITTFLRGEVLLFTK